MVGKSRWQSPGWRRSWWVTGGRTSFCPVDIKMPSFLSRLCSFPNFMLRLFTFNLLLFKTAHEDRSQTWKVSTWRPLRGPLSPKASGCPKLGAKSAMNRQCWAHNVLSYRGEAMAVFWPSGHSMQVVREGQGLGYVGSRGGSILLDNIHSWMWSWYFSSCIGRIKFLFRRLAHLWRKEEKRCSALCVSGGWSVGASSGPVRSQTPCTFSQTGKEDLLFPWGDVTEEKLVRLPCYSIELHSPVEMAKL